MTDPVTTAPAQPVAQFTAKIAEELLPFSRPITDCSPHPDNIRKHDLTAIARSLEAHGQRSMIVVQASTGFIVKGNGTWEAAVKLGWNEIAQSWQELTDEQAFAYLIADNRASDRAKYDRDKTIAGLNKMMAGPGLFDTLWETDELEDLIAEAGAVPESAPEEFKGDYADAGAGAEARKEKASKPGEKMREVPLVLTLADHAAFVERIKRLQKLFGTSGVIATIVEAVKRQADGAANAIPVGSAEEVRVSTLRAARDYFLGQGQPTYSVGAIAAFFQSAMAPMLPEAPAEEPAVVPGQIGMLDDLPSTDDGQLI